MSLAAVFPGQGAQSVGMLAEIAQEHPSVQARFAEASDHLGFDLWKLSQDGPAEQLALTENTQPVLLTASVALWDVWRAQFEARGLLVADEVAFMAGHSLGEYSALVCAEAMSFADGVKLVRRRGELMEAAVPAGEGGMATIMGLDDEAIQAACDQADGVVEPANFNAPGQTVIAGAAAAVQQAADLCKEAGAKRAVVLEVSGPFHSPLMSAAKEEFAQALAATEVDMPNIPVVQNVTATVAASVESLQQNLVQQIAAPVLWAKSVQYMVEQGVDTFVECGPGGVLSGLIRRISKPTPTLGTSTPDALAKAVAIEL